MIRETINALLACVVTFLVCAVVYPAAVYGIGHTLFPWQAEGSLIERDGKVIGSALIAQPFASEQYISPRPSSAGAAGYSADAASGSNLATTNPALRDRIALDADRQIASRSADPALKTALDRSTQLGNTADARIPVDLVTASGSGLDPDISTEAARYQATRVAKARNLPVNRVRALIDARADRSGAILGAPVRVNVLLLNLDLDRASASPPSKTH